MRPTDRRALPLLQLGARGPRVAALQCLLNLSGRTERPVSCDGIFGSLTESAVAAFQKSSLLSPDSPGTAGPATWDGLLQSGTYSVVDGVNPASTQIRALENRVAASGAGRVVFLRLFETPPSHPAKPPIIFTRDAFSVPASVWAGLARLRPAFAPFGSVELHGGRALRGAGAGPAVRRLAGLWGVPVSAYAGPYGYAEGHASSRNASSPQWTLFPAEAGLAAWTRQIAQPQTAAPPAPA